MISSMSNSQPVKRVFAHCRAFLIHCFALFCLPQALLASDSSGSEDELGFPKKARIVVGPILSEEEVFIGKLPLNNQKTENETKEKKLSPKAAPNDGKRGNRKRTSMKSIFLPLIGSREEDAIQVHPVDESLPPISPISVEEQSGGGTARSPKPKTLATKKEPSLVDAIMDMSSSKSDDS